MPVMKLDRAAVRLSALLLGAGQLLSGCGGSDREAEASAIWGRPSDALDQVPTEFARKKVLGVAVGPGNAGTALTTAETLFNWAEGAFPAFFPSHSTTLVEGAWFYRSYFASGILLGVNGGDVFVLGGPFGTIPLRVGRVVDFVGSPNRQPHANAGVAQSTTTGSVVFLSGSASSDPDGDRLTYNWSFSAKPVGSLSTLTGANTATPSFVTDVSGTYTLRLVVNDGKENSSDAFVAITASPSALYCGESYGYGTDGLSLYTPDNNFTYSLSSTSASAPDLVTLTWGARYQGSFGSYSGSLKAKLWAVRSPYFGGLINGTVLGEFVPRFTGSGAYSSNQLKAGGYSTNTISSSAANFNPTAGQYCLVITLSQYMPGQCTPSPDGYCIVDWLQFSSAVTFR